MGTGSSLTAMIFQPAFTCFSKVDKLTAQELTDAPYDGIVFEMEHNPYDVGGLGDALQYMLNRKKIAESGAVAPSVTPLARIPANGAEMNQFQAKQVLDRGVYGVITPHVSTVEQAYNMVASCRYAKPTGAALYEPKGVRDDGPATAARCAPRRRSCGPLRGLDLVVAGTRCVALVSLRL